MSETIEDLLERYSLLGTKEDGGPQRCELVQALESYLPNNTVINFFLCILMDQSDYDLTRVEVLKILSLQAPSLNEQVRAITVISEVLLEDHNCLVRQHAAIALSWYWENDEALNVLLRVIADESEDLDVRVNCLDGIHRAGPNQRSTQVLQSVAEGPRMGQYVKPLLNDWFNQSLP